MNTLGYKKDRFNFGEQADFKRLIYTAFYIPIVANLGGTLNNER